MKKLLLLSLFLTGLTLYGGSLFSDNFESYTPGSNLNGQGGWSGCGSIPVGAGSGLATQVARVDQGSSSVCSGNFSIYSGVALIEHSIAGAITPDSVTTLSFDAYAPTGSHNMAVLMDNGEFATGTEGIWIDTDSIHPGWQLGVYGDSQVIAIPGGIGMAVSIKAVIDIPDQIVYAVYDFGSGPQTSYTLSLVGFDLSQVNEVGIWGDYRYGLPQGEIDNLDLSQTRVPEPSTLLMTGLSGLVVLGMRIRTRQSARKRT